MRIGFKVKMKNDATVLILCGGKGERLKPLTESTPKPLVLLKGRPILSYLLDHIKKFQFENIVIAAGYQAEKIHQFFQNNHQDLNVIIVDSGEVDIIDRIKACAPYIKNDFVLMYGDTLADVDLNKLQDFHFSHESKVTITLWPLKSQFGLAEIDCDSNVIRFREKPTLDQWINIGNFYYEHEVLDWLKDFTSYAQFLEFLGKEKKLKGFKHQGVHITVNTLRELEDAEQNIHEFEL
jgi:glucose-1-phosphate cytidylyltransferase